MAVDLKKKKKKMTKQLFLLLLLQILQVLFVFYLFSYLMSLQEESQQHTESRLQLFSEELAQFKAQLARLPKPLIPIQDELSMSPQNLS